MEDRILLLNASNISEELIIQSLLDVDKIRPLIIDIEPDAKSILQSCLSRNYNSRRNQVDASGLMNDIHFIFRKLWMPGKLILFDYDLYDGSDPRSNWFFGGFAGTVRGLGYITLSASRLSDKIHARDLIRHEVGHMFNAPSSGRSNTYENLGLHCSNSLCVMQQKDTVTSSIKYAHERERRKARTYCLQCERDIANYLPN